MKAGDLPRVEIPVGYRSFLGVEGTSTDTRLDGPLYAVNLLDRRRPWAYELYGLLAYRPLRRAGGRVLFKGHRTRVLAGGEHQSRETLLLVRYPEVTAFLVMVRRPYFAALSLLRKLGLGEFLFGFAERLGPGPGWGPEPPPVPRPYRGERDYLLYTFRANRDRAREGLERLGEAVDGSGVELFFAGLTAGTVAVRRAGAASPQPTKLAPPLPWDAVLLLSAGDETVLERVVAGAEIAALRALAGTSAAAFYRREL
ncbi:MAG: hypothetical protein V3T81_07625 [Thermoanaerobaculia bacterium]